MADTARDDAQVIRNALERVDGSAIFTLSRNLEAFIRNASNFAEATPDVVHAEDDLRRECAAFLRHTHAPHFYRSTPEGEAQRERAIEAARRFEDALDRAPPSTMATHLGL